MILIVLICLGSYIKNPVCSVYKCWCPLTSSLSLLPFFTFLTSTSIIYYDPPSPPPFRLPRAPVLLASLSDTTWESGEKLKIDHFWARVYFHFSSLASRGKERNRRGECAFFFFFFWRLCKQKFFQGFCRVRVRRQGVGVEGWDRKRCAKDERVMER